MLRKLSAVTLALGLASVMYAAPPAPGANGSGLSVPVIGSGTTPSGSTAQFNGNFKLTGVHFNSGIVYADGIVSGLVTQTSGVTSLVQTVSTPLVTSPAASGTALAAAAPAASCSILDLVLGPIDLNLLGLDIKTNQIVLNVSAIPGAGNLLGNLLCSVANLLNSPSQQLANLLNQILGILGGL